MPASLHSTHLAAALLILPQAAQAEEGPLLAPTRDLSVTYRVTQAAKDDVAHKLRVTYATQGPMMRVDSYVFPDGHVPFTTLIYDGVHHKRFIAIYALRAYAEEDLTRPEMPEVILDDTTHFTRQGSATVAGLACTEWQITTGKTAGGTVCVTDDGVLLRSATASRVLDASAVNAGAEPGIGFTVASDLRRMRPQPVASFKPPG
jgi:hypothetical protein